MRIEIYRYSQSLIIILLFAKYLTQCNFFTIMDIEIQNGVKKIQNSKNVKIVDSYLTKTSDEFEGSIIVELEDTELLLNATITSYQYEKEDDMITNYIPIVHITTQSGSIQHTSEMNDTRNESKAFKSLVNCIVMYARDYDQYVN